MRTKVSLFLFALLFASLELLAVTIVPMGDEHVQAVQAHLGELETYSLRTTQTMPHAFAAIDDDKMVVGAISFIPKHLEFDTAEEWLQFERETKAQVPEAYRNDALVRRFLALVHDGYVSTLSAFAEQDPYGPVHRALMQFVVDFYSRVEPSAPPELAAVQAVVAAVAPAPRASRKDKGLLQKLKDFKDARVEKWTAEHDQRVQEAAAAKAEKAARKQREREERAARDAQEANERAIREAREAGEREQRFEMRRHERETHRMVRLEAQPIVHPSVQRYFGDTIFPFDHQGEIRMPVMEMHVPDLHVFPGHGSPRIEAKSFTISSSMGGGGFGGF